MPLSGILRRIFHIPQHCRCIDYCNGEPLGRAIVWKGELFGRSIFWEGELFGRAIIWEGEPPGEPIHKSRFVELLWRANLLVSQFTIPDSFNIFGGAKSIAIRINTYVISYISYRRFEIDYEKRLTRRFALPKGSHSQRGRPPKGFARQRGRPLKGVAPPKGTLSQFRICSPRIGTIVMIGVKAVNLVSVFKRFVNYYGAYYVDA